MKRLYEKKDHLIKRNPNLTDAQKSKIIAVLNKYPNLEGNIDWTKSSRLTYEDFKLHILDNAGKSNSQAKKRGLAGLVEGEDYDVLSSKNGETLYAVYSHLASKTLASNRVEPKIWTESKVMNWDSEDEFSGRKVYRNGRGDLVELKPGAKWCISMNDPIYWDDYCLKSKIAFYFLFKEDESLEDKEKKIAISVAFRNKSIVTFTFGDDTSMMDYTLSEEYKNLIFSNLNKCVEKVKQNIRKGLVLNPNTNRYDYKGSITRNFLENLNLLKTDASGNRVGFTIDFGEITGNFLCCELGLISLEGAPQTVGGDFYCYNNQLTSLEGAPHEVGGGFYCYNNQLISLEGAPKEVGGDFDCQGNKLTSLEGAPQGIRGSFYCSWNKLTSLKGAPQIIGGYFDCSNNELTSLEGAPQKCLEGFNCSENKLTSLKEAPQTVGGDFKCSKNSLTSLIGAPQIVGRGFYCSKNKLTSLEGSPEKIVGYFDCSNNCLTSLEGAPQTVGGNFYCRDNKLTSLKGAPQEIGEDFYCSRNPDLHSLEGIGKVKGRIYKGLSF